MATSPSWPDSLDRTHPNKRKEYSEGPGFSIGTKRALNGIKEQIELIDPNDYQIDVVDPEVVARWKTEDGQLKVVGSDRWDNLRDNAQAIAKYIKSKRAIERYQVKTPESEWSNTTMIEVADNQSKSRETDNRGFISKLLGGKSSQPDPDPQESFELPASTAETILGVEQGAPNSEIKDAFKKRAKELHPDNGGTPEQFKELKEARDILLDS